MGRREQADGRGWGSAALAILVAVTAIGGVVGSLAVARMVGGAVADRDRDEFVSASANIASALTTAVQRQEELVAQAAAFLMAVPEADEAAFVAWSRSVGAFERHPELVGWGQVEVVPGERAAEFLSRWGAPAATVTPVGERSYHCLFKMADLRTSRQALPRGFDFCAATGDAAGPTSLDPTSNVVQMIRTETHHLFIAQAPLPRSRARPMALTQHEPEASGWVGVAVDPQVLVDAVVGMSNTVVAAELTFRDGDSTASFRGGLPAEAPTSRSFDLGGGWTLTAFGDPLSSPTDRTALAVAGAGIVMTALIVVVVGLLGTSRRRAIRAADERTAELAHHALHDPLTGLANRALVLDRLAMGMWRARRVGTRIVALCIDIDDFEAVNDTFGHERGDELLIAIAERLRSTVPEADIIGRLSGDEFVVVIEERYLDGAAELVAERIVDAMSTPFAFADAAAGLPQSCSVGIARGVRDKPADLLRDADIALSCAKVQGKRRAVTYDDQMGADASRRLELEIDLATAIANGEMHLDYQPIHRIDNMRLVCVEALLRWTHPVHGVIEPGEFIPLLERNDQIVEVGAWVMHEACRQTAEWHRQGRAVDVAVNLSARQFDDEAVVDRVMSALDASGLAPTSLVVEITESGLMRRPAVVAERLRSLRDAGVRIAVDDFGTGYSSLAYLRQFPLDSLKIDQQFVASIATSREARALLSTLVHLGHQLGLTVLVEGVETDAQLEQLCRQGIDHVQGFLLSRPLSAAQIELTLPMRRLAIPNRFEASPPTANEVVPATASTDLETTRA